MTETHDCFNTYYIVKIAALDIFYGMPKIQNTIHAGIKSILDSELNRVGIGTEAVRNGEEWKVGWFTSADVYVLPWFCIKLENNGDTIIVMPDAMDKLIEGDSIFEDYGESTITLKSLNDGWSSIDFIDKYDGRVTTEIMDAMFDTGPQRARELIMQSLEPVKYAKYGEIVESVVDQAARVGDSFSKSPKYQQMSYFMEEFCMTYAALKNFSGLIERPQKTAIKRIMSKMTELIRQKRRMT